MSDQMSSQGANASLANASEGGKQREEGKDKEKARRKRMKR